MIHPTESRQGERPDRACRRSGSAHGADHPEPHALRYRRGAGGGARPRAGRAGAADAAGRVRRARLSRRDRAGRTIRRPGRSAASSCPAGMRETERLPEPIFTPATKARSGGTTRRSTSRRPPSSVGRARGRAPSRKSRSRCTSVRPSTRCERGVILADTKFEFGIDADRRRWRVGDEALTPDPRASGPPPLRAGPGAAELRQAVRARLGRSTGRDRTAAAPAIPDESSRPRRALPRGLRADHRRAVLAWLERAGAHEGARAGPAEGRDPRSPGTGRRAALPALGFHGVRTSTSAA